MTFRGQYLQTAGPCGYCFPQWHLWAQWPRKQKKYAARQSDSGQIWIFLTKEWSGSFLICTIRAACAPDALSVHPCSVSSDSFFPVRRIPEISLITVCWSGEMSFSETGLVSAGIFFPVSCCHKIFCICEWRVRFLRNSNLAWTDNSLFL